MLSIGKPAEPNGRQHQMNTIHEGTQEEVLFALNRAIQIAFEADLVSEINAWDFDATGGNCAAYTTDFKLRGMNDTVRVMITGEDVLYFYDGSLADFGSCVTMCMYTDEDMQETVVSWDDEDNAHLMQQDITDLQSLKMAVVAMIVGHVKYVSEVK